MAKNLRLIQMYSKMAAVSTGTTYIAVWLNPTRLSLYQVVPSILILHLLCGLSLDYFMLEAVGSWAVAVQMEFGLSILTFVEVAKYAVICIFEVEAYQMVNCSAVVA